MGRRGSVFGPRSQAILGGLTNRHANLYRVSQEPSEEEMRAMDRARAEYMRKALGNRTEWEACAVAFLAAGNARMADGTKVNSWLSLQDELERARSEGTPISEGARRALRNSSMRAIRAASEAAKRAEKAAIEAQQRQTYAARRRRRMSDRVGAIRRVGAQLVHSAPLPVRRRAAPLPRTAALVTPMDRTEEPLGAREHNLPDETERDDHMTPPPRRSRRSLLGWPSSRTSKYESPPAQSGVPKDRAIEEGYRARTTIPA